MNLETCIILIGIAGFIGWKIRNVRLGRVKLDLEMLYHEIKYRFIHHFSWCNLPVEYLDDVHNVIKACPSITSWDICGFIEGKFQLTEMQRYKILKALENQERIELIHETNGFGYWRCKN